MIVYSAAFLPLNSAKTRSIGYEDEMSPTILSGQTFVGVVVKMLVNDQGGGVIGIEQGLVSPTLRAQTHQHEPIVVLGVELRDQTVTGEVSPTLLLPGGGQQ